MRKSRKEQKQTWWQEQILFGRGLMLFFALILFLLVIMYINCLCPTYHSCLSAREKQKPINIDLDKEKCVEWTNERVQSQFGLIACGIPNSGDAVPFDKYAYDRYCCIKKEPLSECEKGNKDYVLDKQSYIEPYGWVYTKETTCRKKILSDLSCDELWNEMGDRTLYYTFLRRDKLKTLLNVYRDKGCLCGGKE